MRRAGFYAPNGAFQSHGNGPAEAACLSRVLFCRFANFAAIAAFLPRAWSAS